MSEDSITKLAKVGKVFKLKEGRLLRPTTIGHSRAKRVHQSPSGLTIKTLVKRSSSSKRKISWR